VAEYEEYNIASGLSWDLRGENFVVGLLSGQVEVWDGIKM
jgi:hypothetical protein